MATAEEQLIQMLGGMYVIEDMGSQKGYRRLKIQSAVDSSRKGTLCDSYYQIQRGGWFLSDKRQEENREAAMVELLERFKSKRIAVANAEAAILVREAATAMSSREQRRL